MRTDNFDHDTCPHASMTYLENGLPRISPKITERHERVMED